LALVETCSMARRALAVVAAVLIALAASGTVAPGATASAAAVSSAVHIAGTPPTTQPSSVTDNPFIPPDKDLSTCVSANPQPGCGSSAHGGWRQFLTFGIVVLALAFIGWRIVVTVRRGRRQLESSGQR
jgi:hypothetical protein